MFERESKAPQMRWLIIGLALIISSVLAACAGATSDAEETEAPPTATEEVESDEVEATDEVDEDEEPIETEEPEATEEPEQENEVVRVTVGPELRDCVGVAPQTCMLIKKEGETEFSFFYDSIEGFEYEEGFEYDLLVEIVPVEDPPADASSLRWVLVEVIETRDMSQEIVNESSDLEDVEWQLISINDEPIAAEVTVTATFSDGQVSGSGGCNGYLGEYTVEGDSLTINGLLATLMACPGPPSIIESSYLEILRRAESYSIVAGELIIDATQGESLSFITD